MATWPPMLATPASEAGPGAGPWSLEVKYDGIRALVGLSGGRVALRSRRGYDLFARFPRLAAALAAIRVGEAVIDGEVVSFDRRGVSRLHLLQSGGEARLVAFDLLWLEGRDLRALPLGARRDLLAGLVAAAPGSVQLPERLEGDLATATAAARRRGLDGLISKRLGSRYAGGRSRNWRKIKLRESQEAVVVGYVPSPGGGAQVGALLLAVNEGGRLRYAGRVGTGFGDDLRLQLWRALQSVRSAAPTVAGAPRIPRAHWVRPTLVVEVVFAEWTRGGLLRHASFKSVRPDERPSDCVVEAPWSNANS